MDYDASACPARPRFSCSSRCRSRRQIFYDEIDGSLFVDRVSRACESHLAIQDLPAIFFEHSIRKVPPFGSALLRPELWF
jgi:hypothetical protein